jgi:arginyl-tRNA synthetase
MLIRERLGTAITAAAALARNEGALDVDPPLAVQLDVPPSRALGEFTTDVAVSLARQARRPPLEVAVELAQRLAVGSEAPDGDATALVERVEPTPSGFLNFHLRADWLQRVLAEARRSGPDYGRAPDLGAGERVLIEFVSADPWAPLMLSHGRGAALGDALAEVLAWSGYTVVRETYVNDGGPQMDRFARSLLARYLQQLGDTGARVPVDGFPNEYVTELARALAEEQGGRLRDAPDAVDAARAWGRDAVLERQRRTLARFGVRFDACASEAELWRSGVLGAVLQRLRDSGATYEADGALWLASTRYGDTVDRALVRGNGRPTYLAGDLAYHLTRLERGFARQINIWNAEHGEYAARTRAGLRALGYPREAESLEILIFLPVSLKVDGMLVEAPGSGSGATFHGALAGPLNGSLEGLLDEVGPAAARLLFLLRPADAPLQLDLDLARDPSDANPCALVRRALRRSAEVLRAAGSALPPPGEEPPPERDAAAAQRVAAFPDEVRLAAREREPHRLARFAVEAAREVAQLAETAPRAQPHLLPVLEAARQVLLNCLAVLGAPPLDEAAPPAS